jgi:hypothetical protein
VSERKRGSRRKGREKNYSSLATAQGQGAVSRSLKGKNFRNGGVGGVKKLGWGPRRVKRCFCAMVLFEKRECLINGRRWESLSIWGMGGEIDDWERIWW